MEKEYGRAHDSSVQPVNATLHVRLLRLLSSLLRKERADGFTLLELIMTVAIVSSLSSIAIPTYVQQIENARITKAVVEIRYLEKEIITYYATTGQYPQSLADINRDGMKDPWGNPYEYANLQDPDGKVKARKDHFMVPLNTDFDLYSKGRDGDSVAPLTAKASHDDIIRIGDAQYVGLAENFSVGGKDGGNGGGNGGGNDGGNGGGKDDDKGGGKKK